MPRTGGRIGVIKPLGLGVALFASNNLAVVGGWLSTPDGHVPAFLSRGADLAVYQSWLAGFATASHLPAYQAPWQTEPAFFNVLLFLIGRTAGALAIDPRIVYHAAHLLCYVAAASALFYAVRTFADDDRQTRLSWLMVLLSVPVAALAIVPCFIGRAIGLPVPSLPGLGDFVFLSSDGLFHGISASMLVTYGTATTLAAFAWLGRYLDTRRPGFLVAACLTTAASAFGHPFEFILICSAGCLTLLFADPQNRWRGVRDAALLGAAGLLGVLPMAWAVLDTPWLRAAAAVNQWIPPDPVRLVLALGIPVIAALIFLPLTIRERTSARERLLQAWVLCAVVAAYIPWVQWSQHLLDGVLYAAALLVARHLTLIHAPRTNQLFSRPFKPLLIVLLAASLLPAFLFRWQSFVSGGQANPELLFSAVTPRDEPDLIRWLRDHASASDLVLAPDEHAPWVPTVPMHSFASHYVFSLTFDDQQAASKAFYDGLLDERTAMYLLEQYGVRFVVVPEGSKALTYVRGLSPRTRIGSLLVYEFPGHRMRPYPATLTSR